MKKILAVLVFFSLLVTVLLATIDLSPYLAPERLPATTADLPPEGTAVLSPAGTTIGSAASPQSAAFQTTPLAEQAAEVPPQQEQSPAAPGTELPIAQLPVVTSYPELPALPSREATDNPVDQEPPLSPEPSGPTLLPKQLLVFDLVPGSYPYSLLLETFDEKTGAEKAMHQYRQEGLSAYWVKVDLGSKGIKYRLFVGAFADEEQAESFASAHGLDEKSTKQISYACLIGTYEKQELENALDTLKAVDGIPYVMKVEGGKFLLFMGAFYTASGAQELCQDVSARGISCTAQARSSQLSF